MVINVGNEGMPGEGMVFGSVEEVQHALDAGIVHLHAKITARITQIDDNGLEVEKRYETTPGRIRLGALLLASLPLRALETHNGVELRNQSSAM